MCYCLPVFLGVDTYKKDLLSCQWFNVNVADVRINRVFILRSEFIYKRTMFLKTQKKFIFITYIINSI
jgi:hypothetical protein